jgi:uncharacterized protein (TIGR02453 family)
MATDETPRFAGFPREAFTFFRDLAKHNNRDWFQQRKDVYERACRDTLKALTVALDPPFGASRLTRIYRDLRFSKDKSPYRTHISTVVQGNYLSLSAEGLYVGTGIYMPEPATLRRLRAAIADDDSGERLVAVLKTLRKKGYAVDSHQRLVTPPRGCAPDHPRLDLLKMKDLHAGKMFGAAELSSVKAVTLVRKACADLVSLQDWMRKYLRSAGSRAQ